MKKWSSICLLWSLSILKVNAQTPSLTELKEFMENNEMIRSLMIIGGAFLAFRFILDMIRMMLDHSIKIKLLNKGAQEDTIKYFLQPANRFKDQIYKWVAIFTAVGLGFVVISGLMATGIQSLAIMAFSLAAGYLVYQKYLRHFDEPNY